MTSVVKTPHAGHVLRVDTTTFADVAANGIVGVISDAIRQRGRCTLALAGGATPRPVYERISAAPLAGQIAWDRVAIYFGDERCVPPDDEESNYRMIERALLRHVPIPSTSVHRMEAERADTDAAARDYEQLLPNQLDLLLLGMGADGHTASLFPHSPALAERTRRVVPVSRPPPSPPRLTITPLVIHAAAAVIVLVAGAGKATTVARALEGTYTPDELPIQLALRGTWLIDHEAARYLRDGPP